MPKISQNAEVVKIGKWIKERRESLRISRNELAAKIHSTYEMVRLYEEGQCVMRVDRLCEIAQVLGVDTGEWFHT